MINHARTLLLNQSGRLYTPGMLGEEYTPPDFTPVQLPSYVITPNRILFGAAPDKVFLNFRAWELLSIIHETELAEFIYALDPRVTYWPQPQTEFFGKAVTAAAIKKVSGYRRAKAYLRGTLKPDNVNGRAYSEYFVQLAQTGDAVVADITATSAPDNVSEPLEFTNENSSFSQWLTTPVPQLQIQFSDLVPDSVEALLLEDFQDALLTQDYDVLSLEEGEILPFTMPKVMPISSGADLIAQWQLQVYTRPDDAIKICLPKLEVLGEPLFLELFDVRNDVQPYATFKNIWFDHPMPNYRLAAFVLAMIYRTNEIRG